MAPGLEQSDILMGVQDPEFTFAQTSIQESDIVNFVHQRHSNENNQDRTMWQAIMGDYWVSVKVKNNIKVQADSIYHGRRSRAFQWCYSGETLVINDTIS